MKTRPPPSRIQSQCTLSPVCLTFYDSDVFFWYLLGPIDNPTHSVQPAPTVQPPLWFFPIQGDLASFYDGPNCLNVRFSTSAAAAACVHAIRDANWT